MTSGRRAASLLPAACWLLLAGCATRGPLLESTAGTVELADTPFFAQTAHQCGPAALATVLGASGIEVTPELLVSEVYVPGRRGSITVEMQAAPRRHGRLSYALDGELEAITRELDAGRPALVLHNYGLPFWPRWHYAVVVGYDAAKQQVLLRSGTRRRLALSAANFMRAWDNAGRWAIVLLHPGELPAAADRARYLEAAAAFERSATPGAAALAYEAAIRAWPADPIGWVGRGTARYRAGAPREAAADYRRALELDADLAGARNNLAMALLELGCPARAAGELARIDSAALDGALASAVADTRAQVQARATGPDRTDCATPAFP